MVKVTEQHMPLWQFLVRLCGIIGGIFSTTGKWREYLLTKKHLIWNDCLRFLSAGMLHSLVGFCIDTICCRFKLGVYKPKSVSTSSCFLCVAFWIVLELSTDTIVISCLLDECCWWSCEQPDASSFWECWALAGLFSLQHLKRISIWITTVRFRILLIHDIEFGCHLWYCKDP